MFPRRLRAFAPVALALVVVACSPAELAEPSRAAPVTDPPRVAETLIVGMHVPVEMAPEDIGGLTPTELPLSSLHPNGSLRDSVLQRFVYSGVYRLDETQSPVPDLAAEPCEVRADLLVVTCSLRPASFHDGTPLSADDVAFAYQLGLSEACRSQTLCVNADEGRLVAATALDERTVEFRLSQPDPAFITVVLSSRLIEPRARVERAFADFVEASRGADPASLKAVASTLADELRPGRPSECRAPADAVLVEAEGAIADIGMELRGREVYMASPDPCAYGDSLVRVLTDATDALSMTGIDAIAASYRILEPPLIPVGSGPWRVVSIDAGVSMELEAFGAFHGGAPATARVEVRLIRTIAEAIEAVRSGAIHWLVQPFSTEENLIADGIGDAPGVAWAEYNRLSFTALHYNLRDGRLFADRNLRAAIELCLDKDETVAAATGGRGVPVYSPISPSVWAFEADLPRPARDTGKSRELIEASGWTPGDDGIYRKGDQRLTAVVPVREDRPANVRFLELLAFQVAECGIEMVPEPIAGDDFLAALDWPYIPPGGDQPWDAVFSGWITTPDPDFLPIFHSSVIGTPLNPKGNNMMGYASPESDALLEQGRATYDPRERARLYRQHQQILAEDRPLLFAWSPRIREARSDRLESTRGQLATDTSTWWWQLENLVLRSPEP